MSVDFRTFLLPSVIFRECKSMSMEGNNEKAEQMREKPKPKLEPRFVDNLNTISQERLQRAIIDQEKTGWTFYSEREFIESLFNQRFNYLIVMFSLFITAAASVSSKQNLLIVLFLGLTFSFLMSLTIYRAYVKLIILLDILYKLGGNQVFP